MYEADDPNGRRNTPPDHRTFDFRLRFLPRQADSVRRQVTILTGEDESTPFDFCFTLLFLLFVC